MSHTLSEADSKELLSEFSLPFAPEVLATNPDEAVDAALSVGLPVAVKLCGKNVSHKTERRLVRLNVGSDEDVRTIAEELLEAATAADEATGVLVAPMISGAREFIAGLSHDEQFGMTVLFGLGGVFAESIADVAIRLVPITRLDAQEMIEQLQNVSLLDEFRGEMAVDREAVIDVLMALSEAASNRPEIVSVDINPLIISNGLPVAVDALVEVNS
ncbi:MAG TPA: acetate--CoA ligase family protein [Microthrixaceae bacterium]|nr:acetate--CoA ligase family protein [Microthrixaceae bacterium]